MLLTDGVVQVAPPEDEDAPEVARAVQASLTTLSAWMSWATSDYTEASALGWMAHSRATGQRPFLIRDPTRAIVGGCGLQQADDANRSIQLGYWLGSAHTGRGYVTRAARLLIAHALDDLDYHRVEILIAVDNERSRRVVERLGAPLEATLRERILVGDVWHDALLYAVVA
jgi:ribosomal-protein-serine acetyltransferase